MGSAEIAQFLSEVVVCVLILLARELFARRAERRAQLAKIEELIRLYHERTGAEVLLSIKGVEGEIDLEIPRKIIETRKKKWWQRKRNS